MKIPVSVISFLLALHAHPLWAAEELGQQWTLPRTEHGHPDFQGLWGNASLTPLSRPTNLENKLVYTEQEALALEAEALTADIEKAADIDPDREAPPAGDRIGLQADNNFTDMRINVAKVNGEYRTSLIVDPENGRLPYLENWRENNIYGRWRAQGLGDFDGPEIRPAGERCLSALGNMPAMVILFYNSNIQIVQNQDYVMILGEMIHDARIIRLNSEHHPNDNIKYWFGDSIGHWEEDTLVVHTKNFRPETSNFRIASTDLLDVTERFELTAQNEIFYSYTASDPNLYSREFSVEIPLNRLPAGERIYEYACHEGNYSLPSILAGARRQELEQTAENQ